MHYNVFPSSTWLCLRMHIMFSLSCLNSTMSNTNLDKRNAGPSLIPFEATNLNRLKIIHLERTGIPCSIWRLNWKRQALNQWNTDTIIYCDKPTCNSKWSTITNQKELGSKLEIRKYLITWKKLLSFAFANWDSCFNTTILSCGLPLHQAMYIIWSKSVQHQENWNTRILNYLHVKGNPS